MNVVFLHGLGVGPESWNAQISGLGSQYRSFGPEIPGLANGEFTIDGAAAEIWRQITERGLAPVHLCGLSLGAILATRIALDHPDEVASLVLSGGQVRPNWKLMTVQRAVMRLLPARVVAPSGIRKKHVLSTLRQVAHIDFRDQLAEIKAPTMVLCGSKDAPNLPAARELAAGIPDANLHVIPGGLHQLNTQWPEVFTEHLTAFYADIAAR